MTQDRYADFQLWLSALEARERGWPTKPLLIDFVPSDTERPVHVFTRLDKPGSEKKMLTKHAEWEALLYGASGASSKQAYVDWLASRFDGSRPLQVRKNEAGKIVITNLMFRWQDGEECMQLVRPS